MSEEEALAYWIGSEKETFVAEDEGAILGTYNMRPNQPGGGKHVELWLHDQCSSNRPRVSAPDVPHSLSHARQRGYRAMQFNFVVSTNERAVRLWERLGFKVVGRLPLAFDHPQRGYVDALVMFQPL